MLQAEAKKTQHESGASAWKRSTDVSVGYAVDEEHSHCQGLSQNIPCGIQGLFFADRDTVEKKKHTPPSANWYQVGGG